MDNPQDKVNAPKPHSPEHASSLDVMREFAASVYDGAIGDVVNHFKSQSQKADNEPKLSGSMETAQSWGRGVGEVLDVAAIAALAHVGLRKAGVFGRGAAKEAVVHTMEIENPHAIENALKTEKQFSGHLEVKPHTSVLTNEFGTFERDHKTGSLAHAAANGDVYGFPVNGTFKMGVAGDAKDMMRGDYYFIKRKDGSEIVFNGLDEARYASSDHGPTTKRWNFDLRDGSFTMRTDGGGTHALSADDRGIGEAVSWGGPSGMDRLGIPFVYNKETRMAGPYLVPDRTPMSAATREHIENARSILEQAALKNGS